MRKYEVMLAIRGSLTESESKKAYEVFVAHIKKNKGEITYEESWGKMNIAYKIKHETEAHYFVVNFNYDPQKISELETFFEIDKDIIRHLVTKIEKSDYVPATKEMHDASVAAFYAEKETRQRRAAPKTRATTTAQLERDMKDIKKTPKKEKSAEEKFDKVLEDLSI